MQDGLLVPHSLDAEREVLGSVLVNPSVMDEVLLTGLGAEDFYQKKHGLIWSAMLEVYASEGHLDEVTLVQKLKDRKHYREMGGPVTLGEILDKAGISTSAPRYSAIVLEKAARRAMIDAGEEVIRLGHSDIPSEAALDQAENCIRSLQKRSGVTDGVDAHSGIKEHLERVYAIQDGKYDPTIISTGITPLDETIGGGLRPGWLVVVMSCAGHGKSALAINNFAMSAAKAEHPVLVCSYEMSQPEVYARMLASESGVPAHVQDKPGLEFERLTALTAAADKLAPLPLWVVGSEARTVERIRRVARRMHLRYGRIGMVVVDYLQLMSQTRSRRDGTKEEEISHNTRSLKLLAQELDCVVVVLSQPILEAKRAKKRPCIQDSKGSGAIEDDADLALVPWLPHRVRDAANKHDAEIGVDKFRHGPTRDLGVEQIRWSGRRMMFLGDDGIRIMGEI